MERGCYDGTRIGQRIALANDLGRELWCDYVHWVRPEAHPKSALIEHVHDSLGNRRIMQTRLDDRGNADCGRVLRSCAVLQLKPNQYTFGANSGRVGR